MNIHSAMPAATTPRRRSAEVPASPGKRDAILRAAIDVFAERGFFNAQVADVARAAGVAAGTVYLYFKSKDDLLVSIFEHSMRRLAHGHLARLGRDRNLAIVCQVELRQSTKFMERFSATLLRDYLGLIRGIVAAGQASGVFRDDVSPTLAAKLLFGGLDVMATNWILSRRTYSLGREADAIVDVFVGGLGVGARRRSARESARRPRAVRR